jgi:hypothetical protein
MNQATNCSHVFLPNYPLSSQSCPLSSKDYSFFFDKKKKEWLVYLVIVMLMPLSIMANSKVK